MSLNLRQTKALLLFCREPHTLTEIRDHLAGPSLLQVANAVGRLQKDGFLIGGPAGGRIVWLTTPAGRNRAGDWSV